MKLHCETVQTKTEGTKFKIRYWQEGKNKVLPSSEHPVFKSLEDARLWCKQQNEKNTSLRIIAHNNNLSEIIFKNDRIGDVNQLINEFLEWHKISAKNTHETAKCWLLIYIFPFFLSKKVSFKSWPDYYEEFKEHLLFIKSEKTGQHLSYSSRNHVIKYLNLFLVFIKSKKKLMSSFDKCPYFPKSLVNARGIESLINGNEQALLIAKMENNESLKFLYVLLKTGLRLNELFSLQAVCIEADLSNLKPLILRPFETIGFHLYGYIRLESQISNPNPKNVRDQNGHIARKPLKCRKKIGQENHRIIPIFDKRAWDILVKFRRRASEDYKKLKYRTKDVNDYLVFNVPLQKLTKEISSHFQGKKSAHCARHTFTTELVAKFLEYNIGPEYIRHITGHGMDEWRRYTHLVLDEESEKRKRQFVDF